MGQQLNKIVKRRRRAAYLKRKNELTKQGISRKVSRPAKSAADADKKAAKKSAPKKSTKAPATKKPAAPVEETTPTPAVQDTAPAPAAAQDAAPTAEENS